MNEMTPIQVRVLGCLMEKKETTPDQYPLTLNALRNACNQKSSRNPVTNYTEGEVGHVLQEDPLVLDGLKEVGLKELAEGEVAPWEVWKTGRAAHTGKKGGQGGA